MKEDAVVDLPLPQTVTVQTSVDETGYEIVDGRLLETAPLSAELQVMAFKFALRLSMYGEERDLGMAYTEILIKLPLRMDRKCRPDACFIPYAHWPKSKPVPATDAWEVLPSLCIEVVSPKDKAEELMTKLKEYIDSGVRQVWIAYPRIGELYVYDSLSTLRVLTQNDVLDGGTLFPGFRLALSEIFPTSKK